MRRSVPSTWTTMKEAAPYETIANEATGARHERELEEAVEEIKGKIKEEIKEGKDLRRTIQNRGGEEEEE